jgi:hypothetical protein
MGAQPKIPVEKKNLKLFCPVFFEKIFPENSGKNIPVKKKS